MADKQAEALDGEKTPAEMIQTDKYGAAGVKGKQRLPDEYLALILALPRDKRLPLDSEAEEMALMTEERRRQYKEGATLSEMIYADFVKFQKKVLAEFLEKGYVEVADDYLANVDKPDKEGRAMWEEMKKRRNPRLTARGPNYVPFYPPFDPVKQARSLLSDED